MISILTRTIVLAWLTTAVASAQDWPHWRGPNFNGSAPEQPLPDRFGKEEGVAWKTRMPGEAASTPIIMGDRIFISSVDASTRSLLAFALDRKTGKELWRHKIADGDRRDERSNYASPSPTTDGRHVWFFYGQGDLVAFTVEGEEVWRRNIERDHGQFAFQWTFSSSPLLFDGRLYLQVLQRDVPVHGRGRRGGESYLLAMDPETGRDLWRHVRPSDARAESLEAFSSPVPYTWEGRTEILIAGGDCISGHDPETGREFWRWGTWNPRRIEHWRLVPSPVAGDGIILACAPKREPVYAIKAGQNGTLADSGYAWKSADREVSSDVSTPLFYRGRFFVLNSDDKYISCVDPATGKPHWIGELPGAKIESSPTAADGKIYCISHSGEVFVIGAGDKFELLHSVRMGEPRDREVRSSIAIAHGQLFIRTGSMLYAVGPKA